MRQQRRGPGHLFVASMSLWVLLGLPGCLATQGWVLPRLTPLTERVSAVEGRIGQRKARRQQVSGKADVARDRLAPLCLERRVILTLTEGTQVACAATAMTPAAR